MRGFIFVILLLLNFLVLQAQEPTLHIKMYVSKDTVLLRWAPGDAQTWQAGNKYGYLVERFEFTTDEDSKSQPMPVLLTKTPIVPAEESMLDALLEEDEYTAIVLSAIYGNEFEPVSPLENKKGYKNYLQEIQMRHGFALLSADLSVAAARAHGLYLADLVPDTSKQYAYRISLADTSLGVSPAVILYEKERKNLEPLPVLHAQFADSTTVLHWEKSRLQSYYSGYIVERSDDKGKTFRTITKKPIVPIDNIEQPDRVFYVDTLPVLLKEYQYRIRGVNSFGRLSPPSNIASGRGVPEFTIQAHIDSIASLPNQTVYLSWKLDGKDEGQISGFDILRSDSLHGTWQSLNKSPLKPKTRYYIDKKPLGYGYYRVKTHGIHGGFTLSYTQVGMVIDSVPPTAPRQLAGTIDTSGIVRLSWDPSPEPDVKGYRLFRGNSEQELIEITDSLCTTHSFTDTIGIGISPFVFYRVAATDANYNRSDLSTPIRLTRPDTVPPVAALITELREINDSIIIFWIVSPSIDVAAYYLVRTDETNKDSLVLEIFKPGKLPDLNVFVDLKYVPNRTYQYHLITKDNSGNTSISHSRKLLVGNGFLPIVKNLRGVADRKNKCVVLTWEYAIEDIYQFKIYRLTKEEKPICIGVVDAKTYRYNDIDVQPNNVYDYFVQAENTEFKASMVGPKTSIVY